MSMGGGGEFTDVDKALAGLGGFKLLWFEGLRLLGSKGSGFTGLRVEVLKGSGFQGL